MASDSDQPLYSRCPTLTATPSRQRWPTHQASSVLTGG